MPKFRVVTKCHWGNKLWREGDVVQINGKIPPHHFVPVGDDAVVTAKMLGDNSEVHPLSFKSTPDEVTTFSQIAKKKSSAIKTGFAHTLSEDVPI